MIDYIKYNYEWMGAVVVPILVAIVGGIIHLFKKSERNQKIGDIIGNGNTIINGNVNKHSNK